MCPVSADNLEKVQRVATEMVFELLKEKLTELGLFSLEEDEGGCVGTNNCSPCVKDGYRDTSIHGFQTTTVAAKENSNGIQRDRSSDQAFKAVE